MDSEIDVRFESTDLKVNFGKPKADGHWIHYKGWLV